MKFILTDNKAERERDWPDDRWYDAISQVDNGAEEMSSPGHRAAYENIAGTRKEIFLRMVGVTLW